MAIASSIRSLPHELLDGCLVYLSGEVLAIVTRVCKEWKRLIEEETSTVGDANIPLLALERDCAKKESIFGGFHLPLSQIGDRSRLSPAPRGFVLTGAPAAVRDKAWNSLLSAVVHHGMPIKQAINERAFSRALTIPEEPHQRKRRGAVVISRSLSV